MEEFFKEVAAIKGMMADIRRNQGRLQEAHERSRTVTRSEEMKKLREQMQVGGWGGWVGWRVQWMVGAHSKLGAGSRLAASAVLQRRAAPGRARQCRSCLVPTLLGSPTVGWPSLTYT